MKKLNISLNVRRMEAQNILTTSAIAVTNEVVSGTDAEHKIAVEAPGRGNAGAMPVRTGF